MAILDLHHELTQDLPLDLVEQFIRTQGWTCRRVHDDEMAAEYRGNGAIIRCISPGPARSPPSISAVPLMFDPGRQKRPC